MQITLQELNMTYPNGKKALQGVSASLDSPSLIGLLGPNGAGKSTLMKLLVAAPAAHRRRHTGGRRASDQMRAGATRPASAICLRTSVCLTS